MHLLPRDPASPSLLCCVTSAILMEFTGHDPGVCVCVCVCVVEWSALFYLPWHAWLPHFFLAAGVLLVSDIVHKLLLISPAPEHLALVLLRVLLERLGERSVLAHLFVDMLRPDSQPPASFKAVRPAILPRLCRSICGFEANC